MATKYNHIIDNVTFSIEDDSRKTFPKLSHSNTDVEGGLIKKLVNAVEIDWNGADLYNATGVWPKPDPNDSTKDYTIHTTGELLAAIKAAYEHCSPMLAN